MNNQEIVAKLWNLCNVLRDDGITYQQYVTELTYILFLKMCKETGTEGPIRFTPAKETVRIDLEYPDFAKWVESNGATNNDWYLYYQSSKE